MGKIKPQVMYNHCVKEIMGPYSTYGECVVPENIHTPPTDG